MTAIAADEYKNIVANNMDDEQWAYFSYLDPGTGRVIAKRCSLIEQEGDEWYIRYFDEYLQLFTYSYVNKSKITLDNEVEELAFYVIKNKSSGAYHTSVQSSSTAPQLYLTKGKAESRRKQKVMPDQWVVMKWTISEREA